jgi:lauroyl/myristoyl acyltransferase
MLGAIVMGISGTTFNMIAYVLGGMPSGLRCRIADIGALMHYAASPTKRANVRRNLSGIGASAERGSVFGIFRHHAANMTEMFASSRWDAERLSKGIECSDTSILDEELGKKRGIIIATVHTGNWELAALFLSHLGYRMNVVAGVQMNRFLTEAVKAAKERHGIAVFNPEHSYRRLIESLSSNGIVALLLDGNIYTSGMEVELFNRRIIVPRGAVALCRRSGAPVLGGFCRRTGRGRYRIHIEKIIDAEECRKLSEPEAQKRLYAKVGEYISRNSDQWCMFRDFWGLQQ